MDIRPTRTLDELLEADRLIATAFLHPWDAERARRERTEAAAKPDTGREMWVARDAGRTVSAVDTLRHERAFDGAFVPCGEFHMVGTLPEARGTGAVRALASEVLQAFRARGDLFATLIPFSEAFYRKFGFEPASDELQQSFDINQLAGLQCNLAVRQLSTAHELVEMRALWEHWACSHNLAPRGNDEDWIFRAPSQYGRRAWQHEDKEHYSYLFYDGQQALRAYLTFVFVPGPEGPFTGTLEVADMAYDSSTALREALGFIYGMRAKIEDVKLTLPLEDDLATMLPEAGKVRRTVETHVMLRTLDVAEVLRRMRHPQGRGTYSLHVEDTFMPTWSGTWEVRYDDGRAIEVRTCDAAVPDLELDAGTFGQLAVGHLSLSQVLWRPQVQVHAQAELLEQLFAHKPTFTEA